MKKWIHNFFSGYLFIILILLAEIAAIVFFEYFLENYVELFGVNDDSQISKISSIIYFSARTIAFVISVIIFFKIVNRQESPDFKIPWIAAMIVFPIAASALFLIFANHRLYRKEKRVINNYHRQIKDFIVDDSDYDIGDARGAFNYLKNTTYLNICKNNKVTYYKNGETFFPDLVDKLKEAKEFIFIEFFILDEGKVWKEIKDVIIEKAKAGVEVRLVYDDLGSSGLVSTKLPKELGKYGIRCYKFHPFRPILSGAYNNRDHRKIIVIDHKYGFTGGMNLADEYANYVTHFGYWKDTMVCIEGSGINNLILTFLQNYDLAANFNSNYQKYIDYKYEEYENSGFVMPFGDGPGGIDDALVGEQNYINLLNHAKKSVYISTPYLIPTYSLMDAIRNASLRGVDVNIIVPGVPDKKLIYACTKANFNFLLNAGVKIYLYKPGFNHMKSVIVDDELAFVGTINLDFRSLVHHFECGTIIYKNECLKDIKKDFLEMIEASEVVPTDYRLPLGTKSICTLIKIFTPLL